MHGIWLIIISCWVFIVTACDTSKHPINKPKPEATHVPTNSYEVVNWTDLLPDEDLQALENPPEYLSLIEDGSQEDQLVSQFKAQTNDIDDEYQRALMSKQVRPEFNGRNIRIPGYIVPIEFDDNQTITTFFLVPFFGACIHMPPPPPNQIIYATYASGFQLDALYDPFWISGKLTTHLVENQIASAAYTIIVTDVEPYEENKYD